MAWKFFNIGKANSRIEELEAENAQLKAQLQASETAIPEAVTHLQSELAAATQAREQSSTALKAAEQNVGTLTEQNKALTGQVADLQKQLEAKSKEVEAKAAAKAAEITASVGAPPKPVAPAAGKTTGNTQSQSGISRILAAAEHDLQAGGYIPKR